MKIINSMTFTKSFRTQASSLNFTNTEGPQVNGLILRNFLGIYFDCEWDDPGGEKRTQCGEGEEVVTWKLILYKSRMRSIDPKFPVAMVSETLDHFNVNCWGTITNCVPSTLIFVLFGYNNKLCTIYIDICGSLELTGECFELEYKG
ncbi:hypothetical protein KUTeg_009042 [Tegillarca granosa]|uniref:Uncharacterized protein n=1 Tax=Tegillarca granosa TaxID=220873 RepID=A0ABQ9F7R7_TEGGR|nr:hypothetical protein KUTeg_009042 [Tegillarca granosa]